MDKALACIPSVFLFLCVSLHLSLTPSVWRDYKTVMENKYEIGENGTCITTAKQDGQDGAKINLLSRNTRRSASLWFNKALKYSSRLN